MPVLLGLLAMMQGAELVVSSPTTDVWLKLIDTLQVVLLALIAAKFNQHGKTLNTVKDTVNGKMEQKQAEVDLLRAQLMRAGLEPERLPRRKDDPV